MPSQRRDICVCGVSENASKVTAQPIQWDGRAGEYWMIWGRRGRMAVYFCPFCGGSFPKAARPSGFKEVTEQEEARIVDMFRGMHNEGDVLAKFGLPDEVRDFAAATHQPARSGASDESEATRGLVYKRLSPVAEIIFEIGPGTSARGTWSPKLRGDSPR